MINLDRQNRFIHISNGPDRKKVLRITTHAQKENSRADPSAHRGPLGVAAPAVKVKLVLCKVAPFPG